MQEKIDDFLNDPLAQKLLFFNEMLTPSLVRLAYWLCLLAVAWTGLGHMFSGGFGNFLEGIAFIVTGCVLARIAAELVMVLFKLLDRMDQVANNTRALPERSEPAAKPATASKKVTRKTAKKTSKKKVTKKKVAKKKVTKKAAAKKADE